MDRRAAHERLPGLSRREFLAGTVAAAAGATVGSGPASMLRADDTPATQPAAPLVVRATSDYVVEGRHVHAHILGEMLDGGLERLTEAPTAADAWRSLLKPDDIVGLKFNQSGAAGLGTSGAFAEALTRSLVDAGWDSKQIVPIEVPDPVYDATKTTRPRSDWDSKIVDFGSGKDQLASVLRQVTAIINVPFLKTHNIARITCCLKNLSHALVKHPARYHGNHCSPYVGDIVALPQIRDKLRLNIVNALRVVFDRGPEAHNTCVSEAGTLLLGTDPVAVDSVGLDLINQERKSRSLPYADAGAGRVEYLRGAARRGLGCADLFAIRVVEKHH